MLKLSPTRTVIRGDSDKFRITFRKPSTTSNTESTPIDITGWTIRFTVRNAVPSSSITTDTDALISQEATLIDPTNGIALVYVQSATTTALTPGVYLYDIQVIKPIDEYGFQQVSSIRRGKYVVIGDITRNSSVVVTDDFQVTYTSSTGNANVLDASYDETESNVNINNGLAVSYYNGDTSIREVVDDADDGYTI